jgi:hypothetical protein
VRPGCWVVTTAGLMVLSSPTVQPSAGHCQPGASGLQGQEVRCSGAKKLCRFHPRFDRCCKRDAEMLLSPYYQVLFAMPACVLCRASRNHCTPQRRGLEEDPIFLSILNALNSLSLGKTVYVYIHPPGGQGPRVHLIWAIISSPNPFLALKLNHFAQKDQLGVLLRPTMGNHLSTHPANLVVYG